MKIAQLGATLALVAATTVACGGSPTDASVKDFCASFDNVDKAGEKLADDASDKEHIQALKDAYKEVTDTGTPEGIPEKAREGYDFIADTVSGLDDDTSEKEFNKIFEDFDKTEKAQIEAFNTYYAEKCASSE